ncbi:MAG TPA: DNA-formamidopyrimidine glycosylase family protein [Terracidiphilus sp.]|jgi:endonuclease-8|nr:DNA-formamidopyrimidine glycosylase family protein [Terracidiphilus sp.]
MPEGDTIFRSARSLGRALGGKIITGFRSTYPLLTRFHDDTPLTGQIVEQVESRGKWLLMRFSGGGTLATHMLMSGSWHIYRPGEHWQKPRSAARIVIENAEYHAIGFNVPVAEMHTAQTIARDRRFPQQEDDLLGAEFDADAALERILGYPGEEIGDVLLHQRVMAGLGNVFKAETCFVAGIHPFARIGTLTRAEVQRVIRVARRQLGANVMEDAADMIVTWRGAGRRTTHRSEPTESLWVYGRNGDPCRKCGARIRKRIQGFNARVTFWCPACQPMPDGSDVDG